VATGELGYHGQEGYRTRHDDAHRGVPLPTHQRPCGDLFGGEQNHPEYDPAHPAGYETASTGLMMVGAREYDPEIGRFLQPDPQPTGPELQWGQLNRWAYCANDPVNASDPSGATFDTFIGSILIGMGVAMISLVSVATFSTGGLGALAPQLVAAFIYGLALILQGIAMILDDQGYSCLADSFHFMSGAFATGAAFVGLGGWGGAIGAAGGIANWVAKALNLLGNVRMLSGGASWAASMRGLLS